MSDPAAIPASTSERLRIAVLLDGFELTAWVRAILAEIRAAQDRELVLVVLNRAPRPRGGVLARLWAARGTWLYTLFTRLDRALGAPADDALRRGDARALLAGVPVLEVVPAQTRFSDRFPPEALERLAEHRPDVMLRFGFRILRGEVLDAARLGVWSFHHGDPDRYRGGPSGFWEVIEGYPTTGSVLQVLSEELDAGRVLYRSWAATHRYSVAANRSHVYWKSAAFVGRALRRLQSEGAPTPEPAPETYRPYAHRLYRKPSEAVFLPWLVRFTARVVAEKTANLLGRPQWRIAFGLDPKRVAPAGGFYGFRHAVPPRDRFWADPFPIADRSGFWIFVEEYLYRRRRGHVAAMRVEADGSWQKPIPVLEADHHLSYPFVFRWRGELFMLPESGELGRVELYRCRELPARWELETVLMELPRAVDATLEEIDGRWWMFVNQGLAGMRNANDELHLFHAPSPLGPWEPHPQNPVRSDVRAARPAGRLFRHDGRLYRPAQDASRRYGWAIVIHEVERIDRHEYREREVARIEPSWAPGLLGNHTLNSCPGLTVIDALCRRSRLGSVPGGRR